MTSPAAPSPAPDPALSGPGSSDSGTLSPTTSNLADDGGPGQPGPHGHELGELADAVAAAARSVPGVADLHTGAFGEVATYLPGRRVNGIRLRDDTTEVHFVVTWGSPVLVTADQVRAAVAALVSTPVDVTVEDVVDPEAAAAASPAAVGPNGGPQRDLPHPTGPLDRPGNDRPIHDDSGPAPTF